MTASSGVRGLIAVLVAVCALALTACTVGVGKLGAPAPARVVIHLGAADVNNPQLSTFVEAVAASSHHRITVNVDRKTYFSETPGGELKLPAAVTAGKVDLGYSPSRDWAQAGASGFAALQSPGLITTTAQEIRLSHEPIAADLLGSLGDHGAVGLALVPDEPRRLITRSPVLTTADLSGERIRIGDSDGTAAMIRALGGTAVQGIVAAQTKARLEQGTLDGVETGPTPASQNTYQVPAPYLTSFALIPKFEVLAANRSFWSRLSSADRRILQTAATTTVRRADTDVPAREAHQLQLLCLDGAIIVRPPTDALAAIFAAATKARPSDAAGRALIERIEAGADATAPQADASAIPARCKVSTTAAAAEQLHHDEGASAGTSSTSNPAQLVGTYQVVVTTQDWARGGVVGHDWATDVTFTYKLSADGTMYETQQPDFPDQGPLAGTWRVHGDRITFVSGTPGTAEHDFNETVSWSLFKGVLHLKPLVVQDQPGTVIYSVPWRKIA